MIKVKDEFYLKIKDSIITIDFDSLKDKLNPYDIQIILNFREKFCFRSLTYVISDTKTVQEIYDILGLPCNYYEHITVIGEDSDETIKKDFQEHINKFNSSFICMNEKFLKKCKTQDVSRTVYTITNNGITLVKQPSMNMMDKITIAATNWAKEFVKKNSNKVKNVEEIYKEGFIKGANLQKEANLNKIKSLEEETEQNKKCFEELTDSLNKENKESENPLKENKESETSLSEKRIQELLKEEKILNALRDYGVDNWEGYEMAMDSVEED